MDTRHWLIVTVGCSLASAATWWSCRWWYLRKLDVANRRAQKSDKARQFASQQTMQARKQVEALQKDLAAQLDAMTRAQIERKRSRHLEDALKAAAAADAQADIDIATARPPHGFADTQPMA